MIIVENWLMKEVKFLRQFIRYNVDSLDFYLFHIDYFSLPHTKGI